jgi:RHS repeat-associated protein
LVEKKLPSGERYRFFYDSTGEKALYPDGTCSVANYDKNGRLLRNRDRREISTFLSYNKADMPVKKIGFGNRTLTIDTLHTHHGPARVTHSEFVESQVEILQEQYEYHWSGAVEKVSQAADSKTRTLESSYDAAGNQVAVKATSAGGWSKELAIDPQYHPGGADTDAFNRVAVLEGATAKVILEGSFLGLPSKTKYGSTPAREVAYGYDLLLRPKSLVSNEGTPELNVQMTRDFVGNLLTRESSNYSYDGLQRMVIGEAESYAYDELSNLSRRGSRSYTYQVAGERDKNQMRLAAYNDGSEHALGYDREGNLVSLEDRFDELVYDNLGRLREIIHDSQTDKYQYDASGIRFRREEGSEIIYSMHSGDWIVFQEKYSSGVLAESRFNLIAGGQILGQVRKVGASDPVYLYFGLDNLGSRRVVWNEDGTVKVKFAYSAWGEFSRVGGAAADEWLASFTGKEYDATGLLYFNARYYDPALGRFLTEDPSCKGHSWYSYCNNNPLTYTDPAGREYESAAFAELTGNQPAADQTGRKPGPAERAREGGRKYREIVNRVLEAWEKFNAKYAYDEKSYFAWPLLPLISSPFDPTRPPVPTASGYTPLGHRGIDIAAPLGTPVEATAEGVVSNVRVSESLGVTVEITHPLTGAKLTSTYGHLQAAAAKVGQNVTQGEVIGYVGTTGQSTGPHLHFEVQVQGIAVNPQGLLPGFRSMPPW